MVDPEALKAAIDTHFEWLLVRENGKTFPLQKAEIEITNDDAKVLFAVVDEDGFRVSRVRGFLFDGAEISLELSSQFGKDEETIRLIPRESARELSANIELARLEKANEIARIIASSVPDTKLVRVALNVENGRLAQIEIQSKARGQVVALSDISDSLTPETLLTTAFVNLRELNRRRKKPIDEIWMMSEKKRVRNLRKLHALLNESSKSRINIFEIDRKPDPPKIVELRPLKVSDLWREKPKKLALRPNLEPSETARRIIAPSPEKIDVVYSRNGETLRFHGMAFARVRQMLDREKAWFGIERDRRPLNENSWPEFREFVREIETHRHSDADNKRHDLYRLAPEAWLESILRRNIKLLDANLILSPIYNQFRTSSDKIDLLALRKDGRLVIIELKTSPDREMIFQAADYWRKIELQRRKGELKKARVFGDLEILDKPAFVYTVAPALSFHRDFEMFAGMLAKDVELWRFELHENWREMPKVLQRRSVRD
jgi:hypothetical protein